MKKYIKPTFEFVELRVEEKLASCTKTATENKCQPNGNNGKVINQY